MTVQSEVRRNDYIGNGAVDTYSYGFRIYEEEDLLITQVDPVGVETELVLTADYTVSGVGSFAPASRNITLLAGNLPSGYGLTIRFRTGITQGADLRNQGGFFPEVVEDALDRLTQIDQQQQDEVDRSIKLPETETGIMLLPTLAQRSGRWLAFDGSGDPIASSGPAGAPVSVFMETVLDDTSAAAARATLGAVGNTGNEVINGNKVFSGAGNYATATGTNTYAATLGLTALVAGARHFIVFTNGATSPTPTINPDTLGAKTIKRMDGSPLAAGDIPAGWVGELLDAGADMRLLNPRWLGWTTGDLKMNFLAAAAGGWVAMNDGTIGSAASGATTRANSDTLALYTLLWDNISNTWAPVSTGRGASALADFNANKTITLPRQLGRALAVAGAGATLTSRVLGEYLGAETHTLIEAEMPAHTHSSVVASAGIGPGGGANLVTSGVTGSTGGGAAHNNMQPSGFVNVHIKL